MSGTRNMRLNGFGEVAAALQKSLAISKIYMNSKRLKSFRRSGAV